MSTERKPEVTHGRRWVVPAVGLAIGAGYVAIFLARHDPGMAVAGFLIMAAYVLFLVVASRRSEAVDLLRGETTDERHHAINQRAAAFTLYVVVLVLLAGFMTELVRGRSGHPWDWLCAVLGATYIAATVAFSRRG